MTREQTCRNESSGARSKELSHDLDGSNLKKRKSLTMASKEWLLIKTVKLKVVVKIQKYI